MGNHLQRWRTGDQRRAAEQAAVRQRKLGVIPIVDLVEVYLEKTRTIKNIKRYGW